MLLLAEGSMEVVVGGSTPLLRGETPVENHDQAILRVGDLVLGSPLAPLTVQRNCEHGDTSVSH